MNPSDPSPARKGRIFSPEALVGLGITFAAIGVLFLLLGWAQHMRSVHEATLILGGIGAGFFVLGVIVALAGRVAKGP